jgi:arylsulfatase A-like enzyme
MSGQVEMTEQDFEHLRALSCAELRHVDDWLGRCVSYLDQTGLREDTIMVVLADHGDHFGEHGLLRHGVCLYDTVIKVPLVIAYPRRIGSQRVKGLVQLIDLLPTLMRLAGLHEPEAEREFQGRDILTAVETGAFAEYAVAELYPPIQRGLAKFPDYESEFRRKYDRCLRAIRTEQYKYIWASRGGHELYDLSVDPGECDNIIDRHAGVAAELRTKLEAWLEAVRAPHAGQAPTPGADLDEMAPEVIQRLADLGYLE